MWANDIMFWSTMLYVVVFTIILGTNNRFKL